MFNIYTNLTHEQNALIAKDVAEKGGKKSVGGVRDDRSCASALSHLSSLLSLDPKSMNEVRRVLR